LGLPSNLAYSARGDGDVGLLLLSNSRWIAVGPCCLHQRNAGRAAVAAFGDDDVQGLGAADALNLADEQVEYLIRNRSSFMRC
jgi:hypothetical protein